jgi:hypothetical protein
MTTGSNVEEVAMWILGRWRCGYWGGGDVDIGRDCDEGTSLRHELEDLPLPLYSQEDVSRKSITSCLYKLVTGYVVRNRVSLS